MSAVLCSEMFFETSSDTECDPERAVKQLEHIAWNLGNMSPDEQKRVELSQSERRPPNAMASFQHISGP